MTEVFRDIAYAGQSNTQLMDIYLPEGVKAIRPVILWLHPGGFTMGDKEMIQPVVASMLRRGFAAVSVNYRLAGEARYPAQMFDAKAAVRWIRAAAGKYRFDPDKVISWGVSAGSTLAALLGTTENIKELEDPSMGNPTLSSKVNAAVSWYGPMNFSTLKQQRLKLGQKPFQEEEASGEFQMMGGNISTYPEKYRSASAQTYISTKCPPFYIQHGTADDVVPYLQSVEFASALEAVVGTSRVKLKLIENAGHFDRIHSSPENISEVLDFLDERLK
jgi:acetyl esterase/lipase